MNPISSGHQTLHEQPRITFIFSTDFLYSLSRVQPYKQIYSIIFVLIIFICPPESLEASIMHKRLFISLSLPPERRNCMVTYRLTCNHLLHVESWQIGSPLFRIGRESQGLPYSPHHDKGGGLSASLGRDQGVRLELPYNQPRRTAPCCLLLQCWKNSLLVGSGLIKKAYKNLS